MAEMAEMRDVDVPPPSTAAIQTDFDQCVATKVVAMYLAYVKNITR